MIVTELVVLSYSELEKAIDEYRRFLSGTHHVSDEKFEETVKNHKEKIEKYGTEYVSYATQTDPNLIQILGISSIQNGARFRMDSRQRKYCIGFTIHRPE